MDLSWETVTFVSKLSQLPSELVSVIRTGTNSAFLAALSQAALDPHLTEPIFTHFEPLSVDLCARWTGDRVAAAISALGRMISVLPTLSDVAQHLFTTRSGEFDLLSPLFLNGGATENADSQGDPSSIRQLLLGIFRLLEFDNSIFAKFLRPAKLQFLLQHPDRSVRYLAIRLICQYIRASDAIMEDMNSKYLGTGPISGTWESQTIDYRFLTLWEEKRMTDLRITMLNMRSERHHAIRDKTSLARHIGQQDLSPNVIALSGVLMLTSFESDSRVEPDITLVPTHTTLLNLRQMADALLSPDPLLITGVAGAGKTALVRYLAGVLNKSSRMVTLHLNEQSDAKLLVGIYTTGSQPGSFQWQPGVLTTAVKEGRWVLIEDLDRAPNEIMSTILPLIERRELAVPSRGEKIRAAHGFKIIATIRSSVNLHGIEIASITKMLGHRLWRRVMLQVPDTDEVQHIIAMRYPLLKSYLARIIAVYGRLRALMSGRAGHSRTRSISIRELLNWCGRLSDSLHAAGLRTGHEPVSENLLDSMFIDAADCFTGSMEDDENRDALIACIAEELHVDPRRKVHLLTDRPVVATRSRSEAGDMLCIGRAKLPRVITKSKSAVDTKLTAPYAMNGHSLRLLEQVAVAVQRREPLLLVGETGIGKTTAIQHLAQMLGHRLLAINLSQQSESGDLLGGFKPVNMRSYIIPLKDEFDSLFAETFSQRKNQRFLEQLSRSISRSQWRRAFALWREALKMVDQKFGDLNTIEPTLHYGDSEQRAKRRKVGTSTSPLDRAQWNNFTAKIESLEQRLANSSEAFMFSFAEGKLVKAVRDGDWVLLDEINLATPDTLECLSDLLESGPNSQPSILLTETGNIERVNAHPNFRIFGAMNPATDVGKKDLPMSIRSRFTEIFVNSPDRDVKSLQSIVRMYLDRAGTSSVDRKLVISITELYQDVQRLAQEAGLVDGSGQRPHYSLRTLTRALSHAVATVSQCSIRRALYEGFSMCFFTSLDNASEMKLQQLVKIKLFGNQVTAKAELKKPLRQPDNGKPYSLVTFQVEATEKGKQAEEEKHWLLQGDEPLQDTSDYIITPYIARNLRNLIRAASTQKYPILIQGPTSAGKTSMIDYLAKRSGNTFVRINNHEHTDLQEYLGTYVSTSEGQLVFQDGILVQALRSGHWVVLDELNLAPSDVLEALNRLLDDNRELLIPETQEVVRPHPGFMLFATQNPVGPYGGRKALSRAFRNRFLELHFDDIPVEELNVILARRSKLPESWCGLIVEVYKRLSRLRQEQRLFEQNSFATLRDLFRWAFRGANSVEELADNGYMLLAEKVRKVEEQAMVKETIEQVMSRKGVRIRINHEALYTAARCPEIAMYDRLANGNITWTRAMRRLFVLVSHAVRNNEPILLIGETGCGKTTVCQMLARAMGQSLYTVNAHQNTETGDLIGAQRPIRGRGTVDSDLIGDLHAALMLGMSNDVETLEIEALLRAFDNLSQDELTALPLDVCARIRTNRTKRKTLFEWCDGSLVQAMRAGQHYLLDEISLADDSVLERMNSVLDPQRSILLAEKGTQDSLVVAQQGFQFFATMNPGGDFGKKELSPALRNRFTEIWVPPITDTEDVLQIVLERITSSARASASVLVDFAKWFGNRFSSLKTTTISIRDVLAWVQFINSEQMDTIPAIVHGAALVYIDTLGANPAALLAVTSDSVSRERQLCLDTLSGLLRTDTTVIYNQKIDITIHDRSFTVGPFSISRVAASPLDLNFNFQAPTAKVNAMRVIRALQLGKPVLLEGNPGVGKTSIITAIANAAGKLLTRMNLSEQTDLMDLFGSDVPLENAEPGHFAWRDAPFLTAMKRGDWVLLDEMNLASQSVLEGLNACLDHRGEIYVAELDQIFPRHPDFRLFAAQNPHHQGGGRKGLPASFVNRFTVVYADVFKKDDLQQICSELFPKAETTLITSLVKFVTELDDHVTLKQSFGARGSPWEFNLRDTIRWLQLLTSEQSLLPAGNARDFLDILFTQRFRSDEDAHNVEALFDTVFLQHFPRRNCFINLSQTSIQVGLALLPRKKLSPCEDTVRQLDICHRLGLVESLMLCVRQSWPVILVGSTGVGKSCLLRTLASLVGANLEIFAMNADIDATDLVGGYEQADTSRQVEQILLDLEQVLRGEIARQCALEDVSKNGMENGFGILLEALQYVQSVNAMNVNLSDLQVLLEQLSKLVPSLGVRSVLRLCKTINGKSRSLTSAKFEWIDGILVRALETGCWLVLDNANLCSSSVLDRLNSLLEPNGTLIINEHCLEDGTPRVIKPHPNFRVFMTMDPQHGEVSRAMRNRAVELFVPALDLLPDQLSTEISSLSFESSMQRYHQLLRICNRAEREGLSPEIITIASERLSFSDLSLLQSFLVQTEMGLMSRKSHVILKGIVKRYELLSQLDHCWDSAPLDFYRSLQSQLREPAEFCGAQSIHSLTNQPLVAYNYALQLPHDPYWLGKLHDLFLETVRFEQALLHIRSAPYDPKAMNRLQRSFASARFPQSAKESTVWVGPFLANVLQAIRSWISRSRNDSAKDQLALKALEGVQLFLWDLFQLTSSFSFEEAIFQVHLSLIANMTAKINVTDTSSVQTIDEIKRQFHGFSTSARLTTGLSMEKLWNICRPAAVPTIDRFHVLLQLESVADQFDNTVWSLQAPVSDLSKIQGSISKAITAARYNDVEMGTLLQDLQGVLAVSNTDASENDSSVGRPFFQSIFEGVCQYVDLEGELPPDLGSETALLACRSTKTAYSSISWSSSAQALEKLIKYCGSAGADQAIALTGKLPLKLVQQLSKSSEVTLKQRKLLQFELLTLGRALSVSTARLCTDQPQKILDCLDTVFVDVLHAHEEFLESDYLPKLTPGRFDSRQASENNELSTSSSTPQGHYFRKIAQQYFQSWSSDINSGAQSNQPHDVSDRLIDFSMGCLLLYVPDRSFDPALKAKVQNDLHSRRLRELEDRLHAIVFVEQLVTQSSTNLRSGMVQKAIEELGDAPPALSIARPPVERISELQTEFSNVLRLIERVSRERALVSDPSFPLDEVLESISRSISRFSVVFRAYEDLTKPVIGFLISLKLGLILARTSQHEEDSNTRYVQLLLDSTPLMNAFSNPWNTVAVTISSLPAERHIEFYFHKLGLLAIRSAVENPSTWAVQDQDVLSDLFNCLYTKWKSQLTKDQKTAAANSSLYQYRGSQADEDEAEVFDFGAMFPTFEGEDRENDVSLAIDDSQDPQRLASRLARLHARAFGHQRTAVAQSLEDLLKSTASIIGDVSHRNSFQLNTKSMQQLLPAIFLTVLDRQQSINQDETIATNYNIYQDPNMHEAQKITTLVNQIQDSFRPIAEAWPEHATLQNVLTVCNELLAFKHAEPVMKILTKAEKLYEYIAEWQAVTSKEFSATNVFNMLTDLLISWRQLELTTWSRLLDMESEKSEEEANLWWYVAYENVIVAPLSLDVSPVEMINHTTDLLATLEAFIKASALGQFEPRMHILLSLQSQLELLAVHNPLIQVVGHALANFVVHFMRFVPHVRELLSKGRMKLEKDVKNIIQLASWKDRNINTLKQSAKTSHRKLFKIIRKYRSLLGQSAAPILSQEAITDWSNEVRGSLSTLVTAPSSVQATALSICQNDNQLWSARPKRLKDVEATLVMMRSKTFLLSRDSNGPTRLTEFISNLAESVDHLQKATPAMLTRENASFAKHLLTRKRKLFADTLKEIRQMGLKSNISADVLALQDSLADVLSRMPTLPTGVHIEAVVSARSFIYKILDIMPYVRGAMTEHSDDLSQSEIGRCIANIESFLALCLKQRHTLARSMTSLQALESNIVKIQNLWSTTGCQARSPSPNAGSNMHSLRDTLQWLPPIIKVGERILSAQAELGKLDFSDLVALLRTWANKLSDMNVELLGLPDMPQGLSSTKHDILVGKGLSEVEGFHKAIIEQTVNMPHAKMTLDHILVWVESYSNTPLPSDKANKTVPLDISHIALDQYKTLDMVLGSIQDVARAIQQLPQSVDEPTWLIREDSTQQAALDAFHADRVVVSMEGILSQLQRIQQADETTLSLACASLTMMLPLFQQYYSAYREMTYTYAELHAATCQVTHKLARLFNHIAKQGFCKPVEKSEESASASDKLESGTGLGEGEGAEDISKDIDGDDDLSELAQDQNNKQADGEIENAEDAVDIQDELEGGAGNDTGDVDEKAGEKNDAGSQSGDDVEGDSTGGGEDGVDEGEDEGAMDEEVGSVDDLGPSAVDEKLWDQAGDEANKEKEGKDTSGKIDKDEQVASKENNAKEDQEHADGQDDNDEDQSGADAGETTSSYGSDFGSPEEDDKMDPLVKESDGLELPEELQLDGDKNRENESMGEQSDDGTLDYLEEEVDRPREEETDTAKDPAEQNQDEESAADVNSRSDNESAERAESPQPSDSEDIGHKPDDQTQGVNDRQAQEQDDQSGGRQANEAATEKSDQKHVNADAHDEGLEDETKGQMSASSAQRKTGAESQATEDPQPASMEATQEQEPRPKDTQDQQTIKKLGDILEKWHRQQRHIREVATERPDGQEQPQDTEMADMEFEHLPAEDAHADTQALGASSEEAAHALDESMAIEVNGDEAEQSREVFLPDVEEELEGPNNDVDMEEEAAASGQAESKQANQPQAFMGPRQPPDTSTQQDSRSPSPISSTLSEVEDTLSTMHLEPETPLDALNPTAAATLWQTHTTATHTLSLTLTEHLRLILAPTLATKLRGDFRTGKRLNLKRIIPYIASSYKRDRIWLRRSTPTKRAYQVLLALDDSRSMADDGAADLALATLALVARSLGMLEAGELGILRFGERVHVAHELGRPWSGEAGARVLAGFGFRQGRTDVKELVRRSIELFEEARGRAGPGALAGGAAELWQLELVVSDGVCEDHEGIRRLLVRAQELRIMIVFVVVDAGGAKGQVGQSIVDLEKVEFVEQEGAEEGGEKREMKLRRSKYLDTFPFAYYLIVKDVRELPGVLATALRQWFAEVAER